MARAESNYSYALSLQIMKRRTKKQKIRIKRSIRTIDKSRAFNVCIRRAIEFDGWEGEQETTVGDGEPDDWPDDWQKEWDRIKDDKSHPRYRIFWRCVRRYLSRLVRQDTPPPSPPGIRGNDYDDDGKKYSYSWLLLLTDDLVDEGWDWERIRLLLIKLIRRYQDVLVHVKFEGTMTSMIELGLITPGGRRLRRRNRPKKPFKHFVEDINARDPRIVFELKIHPSLDKNGNNVSPRHSEVYLYGLP